MKSISRLFVKSTCIFGLAACSPQAQLSPGPAGNDPRRELTDRVASSHELAVLFVGNSYSFGVPKEFSKVAAAHGNNVRIGHSTYGGWTLGQHAENEATLKKIRAGRWDIVVLQEQSEIPAMSARKTAAAMFPPLRKLVIEVRQHGAIPVLYQTWGRRDGDPKVRNDDFLAMTARLRAGYHAASVNAGGVVVVPVGDAWEHEFSAGRGGPLFIVDGSHPTEAGNCLTASVFYDTFFGK